MINKTCKLCKKKIEVKNDSYVRLTDYKEGKVLAEGYYHNSCYHAQIQNAVMFNKQKLLGHMKSMFPSLGNQFDEVIKDGR